jgi:hypothetical protein
MNRREALRHTALVAGAAALWASLPARTWAALAAPTGWDVAEETFLTLLGDTIIPSSATSPGAGAVAIGRFILTQTNECFPPEARATLRRGLSEIDALSQQRFAKNFSALDGRQRERVLTEYETQAVAAPHPFRHIKELTVLGYFTAEVGATQALRYDPIPGAFHGSVKLAPGERSWAL